MTGIRQRFFPFLYSFLLFLCCTEMVLSPAAAGPLVGVIMTGNAPYFGELHRAFVDSLKAGSQPGAEPEIILQRPFPDAVAMSNAARKLIAAEVDIIVTYGTPATLAVLKENAKIPVIYSGIYDPAGAGLEGPRLTGCGYKVPLSSLLRYLHELKPISNLTVIYAGNEDDSRRQVEEFARLTAEQQIGLTRINLAKPDDLDRLGSRIEGEGVFLTGCSLVDLWLDRISVILQKRQVLSVSILPDLNDSGITLTLYHPPLDQGRKTAEMVLQVLAGRAPHEIKVETFRNTELVFNLKEAKKLGIRIPFQLVAEATRVIK